MEYYQVSHGSVKAILVLNAIDVNVAYGYAASCYLSIQRYVRSSGWRYSSFGHEEGVMEGKLILRCEVCVPEAVQILY
jgi:hypothetical protein